MDSDYWADLARRLAAIAASPQASENVVTLPPRAQRRQAEAEAMAAAPHLIVPPHPHNAYRLHDGVTYTDPEPPPGVVDRHEHDGGRVIGRAPSILQRLGGFR